MKPIPASLFAHSLPSPLIVGDGKLAKHLTHYLNLKSIAYDRWKDARNLSGEFDSFFQRASFVWLLVSDQALVSLTEELKKRSCEKIMVHSSAACQIPGAFTVHPLQTFGPELYSLETYEKINFTLITEEWSQVPGAVKAWLDLLANPQIQIPAEARVFYHASCSMIANFPQILWTEIFSLVKEKLSLPPAVFLPLLQKSVENYLEMGAKALTGPLVRGDQLTLKKHEVALAGTQLTKIYQDFCELYETTAGERL